MKNFLVLLFVLFVYSGSSSCTPEKIVETQEKQSVDPPPSQEEEEEPNPALTIIVLKLLNKPSKHC